jgi:dihydrofolate reductase
MRKIIVSEFVSVDGVFEDPGGSENFTNSGWQRPFMSDEGGAYKFEELKNTGAILLGRVTYDGFAEAWPKMKNTGQFGELMNSLPKHVVSTTLQKADWNNSHIINDNFAEEINKLKNEDGKDILVYGSGQLTRFLLKENLVDILVLMVHPIILGEGKKLLDSAAKKQLKLLDIKKFQNGTFVLEYSPLS